MRARAPHLCRCPPHNTPQPPPEQRQQDIGADKQEPRTATWSFLSVQEKLRSRKVPWYLPSMCNDSTYQQLVYSNCSSLWSFPSFYLFISLGCITFGVFWFGMLATFSYGKTYVCTGMGEAERAWQEQAHLCMVSFIVLCPAVHTSRNSMCFITCFRTFPKTHVRQTDLVTFSLKKY